MNAIVSDNNLHDYTQFLETIGTVITTANSPTTQRISFVLKSEKIIVNRGNYVEIPNFSQEKIVLGFVQEIQKTNAYFNSADVTKDVSLTSSNSDSLSALFPTNEWATTLISIRPLGELIPRNKKFQRVQFPISPGDLVYRARSNIIKLFLGLVDPNFGINLGTIVSGMTPLVIDITRLLRKHLAILAISGAGKSYTTSIILEELLVRSSENGRLPVIIIDSHGEYIGFTKILNQSSLASVYPGRFISIQTNKLNAYQIKEFLPEMSNVQIRELDKIISKLKKAKKVYSFRDLIEFLANIEKTEIGIRTKESLLGWLNTLDRTSLFGINSYPDIQQLIKPGKISIFDLSDVPSVRIKQIICAYIARTAFNLRRKQKIPPFLLVIEEAHNFCPENRNSISTSIIETIAREGRKFFASMCLISQRPVKLSSTALSQCNSHIIMRIRNPYDLDYLGRLSEGLDKETMKIIPDLDVGEGIIVGEAVNFPVIFKIRKRKFDSGKFETNLIEELQKYE